MNRIYADVQNLGIKRRKLCPTGIEFRYLRRSSRRPIQRMEHYNHVFPPAVVAEPVRSPMLTLHRRQGEVRRTVSHSDRHQSSCRTSPDSVMSELTRDKSCELIFAGCSI
jgi:hypothetical protein